MKIRNGFVSNSSSSSYVIDLKIYPNVFYIAEYMLEEYIEYVKEGFDIKSKDGQKFFKRVKKLLHNLKKIAKEEFDQNTALAFPCVQYDTFIKKVEINDKDYLYVATCNNVMWEIWPDNLDELETKEHGVIHSGDIYDGLLDDELLIGEKFLDLNTLRRFTLKDEWWKGIPKELRS